MKKGKTWLSLFIERATQLKMPAGNSTYPIQMLRQSIRHIF